MRNPNDTNPDPPGGRAAERLREFLEKRAPSEAPPENEESGKEDETGSKNDKSQTDRQENVQPEDDQAAGSNKA